MRTKEKQNKKNSAKGLIKTCLSVIVFLIVWIGHITVTLPSTTATIHIGSAKQNYVFAAVETPQSALQQTTNNSATPATDNANQKAADIDFANIMQSILKVFYVLLWPFLWIAGLAMDNSLIYGEVFHLDKALWQFWQIARNFANFVIGFIFLRQVLKYIFDIKSGKSDTGSVTKIITKLLLSSIGVQMSWFIMGALIDLSSVLTVGLGGLPLNLINDNIASKPVLGIKTSVKINSKVATNDNLVILYTWDGSKLGKDENGKETGKQKYLLPCYIKDNRIVWGDEWTRAFKVLGTTTTGTQTTPAPEKPATQQTTTKEKADETVIPLTVDPSEINTGYCVLGQDVIAEEVYTGINGIYKNSPMIAGDSNMQTLITKSRDIFVTRMGCLESVKLENGTTTHLDSITKSPCTFLGNIANRGAGHQGAFYSLYVSLLGLSSLHLDTPQTTATLTIETLLKIIIALAYLVPLAILVVVLIMRVGYLRVIIAFSPLITLGIVGDILPKKNPLTDLKLTRENIVSLLLLPVVVTFTISLSIVLLSSLSEGFSRQGSLAAVGIYQRVEAGASCYDIGITNICISSKTLNFGGGIMDYFSWIIMNLFGVGLMRFAVMAALKTSELTSKVVGSIEKLATNTMQSMPIIPLPNGGKTSIGGVTGAMNNVSNQIRSVQSQQAQQATEAVEGLLNNMSGKDAPLEKAIADATTEAEKDSSKITKNDLKQFSSILGNDSLFKDAKGNDLHMNAAQIAGLLAYANTLNKKIYGKNVKDFESTEELFTTKKGQDFWNRLSTEASQNDVDVDWNKLQHLYQTDGVKDEKWTVFMNGIDKGTKPKPTYKMINNKLMKQESGKDIDVTKDEFEEFKNKYNEYQDKIKNAKNDTAKKEAENNLNDRYTALGVKDETDFAKLTITDTTNNKTISLKKDENTNTYTLVEKPITTTSASSN